MFFNKKKTKSESVPTATFRPSKLNQESLDNFVKKYQSESDPNRIPYITKDGKKICFALSTVLFDTPGAIEEFKYLLAQTYPYHTYTSPTQSFPISEFAFIMDEKQGKQTWTRDSKVLSQFVTIGNKLGYIPMQKQDKAITSCILQNLKPVTHRERTHTDD